MATTRIYRVTSPAGTRLIDAAVKANAIAFVAKDEIKIEVATGHEIADLVAKGIRVESISGPSTGDLFQQANP
jgi:hypothetical protein